MLFTIIMSSCGECEGECACIIGAGGRGKREREGEDGYQYLNL